MRTKEMSLHVAQAIANSQSFDLGKKGRLYTSYSRWDCKRPPACKGGGQ
jgi:hypothetical protein